jgi:hypothetical protein
VKIFFWILHRLADIGVGGKVHDRVAASKDPGELRGIGDIADDQFKSFRKFFAAIGKIVVDYDIVAFATENVSGMTADVSGAPNHQNGQVFLLELS